MNDEDDDEDDNDDDNDDDDTLNISSVDKCLIGPSAL